jgi:hypothetical protein
MANDIELRSNLKYVIPLSNVDLRHAKTGVDPNEYVSLRSDDLEQSRFFPLVMQ